MRQKGEIRLKAQLHNVSLTFADATNKITLPSSAVTAGFEVGDKIGTNSANAGNQGPFTIITIGGAGNVDLTVDLTSTGGAVAFTDGTENNLTIGTYMVRCLLMRTGFVFNKDTHATLLNLKTNSTAISLTASNGPSKFTRAAGDFTTDGFVVGNYVTTNSAHAANQGPFLISVLTPTVMTVTDTLGVDVVLDVATEPETITITSNNELATGFGYTQDTKLTGVMTITEDDTLDVGDADFPTVTWTAAAGSIGPTPSAIIYDDSTSDNTIIGCYAFSAEETATDGTTFNLAAGKLRAA